jgi:outer membrane protein assembly factor BamB
MEEGSSSSFDDFSVEMADFEVKKVKKFDRIFTVTEGGSIDTYPLVADGRIFFGSHNKNVYCLDQKTGKPIWKFRARDSTGISSPILWEGKIYIGSYDHNLYALDSVSGEMVWKFATRRAIVCCPAIRNGVVYFGSVDQNLYAVDARTGEMKWKFWTSGEVCSDPTFFGDTVIFGSYDKNLYCLKAATGQLVWKLGTSQDIFNTADFAIRDGFMYFASFDNLLRKVDARTGAVVWKKKVCQYGVTCGTVIHRDTLYLPVEDGNMMAFDLDGNLLWKFQTKKPIGVPTIEGDRLFFTAEDQNLYCLSLDGKLIWKFKTFEMNWWRPAVVNGVVYFGSYDCNFYALDAATGALIWKFRAEGSPSKVAPPYTQFELEVKIPESEVKEEKNERYNVFEMDAEKGGGAFYKSRIIYGGSSRYREKGSYGSGGEDDF